MSDTEEEIGEALEMAEIEEMEATFDMSLGLDDGLGRNQHFEPFPRILTVLPKKYVVKQDPGRARQDS